MAEGDRAKVFDELFADGGDPWNLRTSAYEQAKRAATLAMLGERRFRHGVEVGCAFGLLMQELAQRCDRLLALDVSEVALHRARTSLAARHHVTFRHAEVSQNWPKGQFDWLVAERRRTNCYRLDVPRAAPNG